MTLSYKSRRIGSRMNPKRVIFLMTLAVFFVLTVLAVMFFDGIPPWPVLLCFALSHGVFCFVVAQVKPYYGPYTEPLADSDLERWPL